MELTRRLGEPVMSTRYAMVSPPAVAYPEHCVTLADMQALAKHYYGSLRSFRAIQRMIDNTEIERRRFVLPLEQLGVQAGLADRAALYMQHARPLARSVASEALAEAGVAPEDIDLIITTSCTSFSMPALDAYLIDDLELRPTIRRVPLAQLGCVAGVAALRIASDYCLAHPSARVLIVAIELSSLCFFPEYADLSSAVCSSIFGDGAAACVVSGSEHALGSNMRLGESTSYTLRASEHYIRYEVTDAGYHLRLDREVMYAVPRLAPVISEFLRTAGVRELDFVVAHTGGRRILDSLVAALGIDGQLVEHSRASLREVGNTASVSVLDVLERSCRAHRPEPGGREQHGIIIAFGPGFTMELLHAWRA
jgi:phloroglucinol synthase